MHSQRVNEPLSNTWIKTTKDGEVNCAHCDCMAGLGEVCSHVGAVLFYIEATRRAKSCTDLPCPWNMPSHVGAIPYARIADIDFTPRSVISQTRRGAHLNNDCLMISDSIEVELHCSSHHSAGTPLFNANKIAPTESEKLLFFNRIAKHEHKPCCLSLLTPFSDSYIPNAERISSLVATTINYIIIMHIRMKS